jgi:hypothetical protein
LEVTSQTQRATATINPSLLASSTSTSGISTTPSDQRNNNNNNNTSNCNTRRSTSKGGDGGTTGGGESTSPVVLLLPPKAALYQLYGKKPRRIQLQPNDYITWDNGRPTHQQLFTSIFICPTTKEIFFSGPWDDHPTVATTTTSTNATDYSTFSNNNNTSYNNTTVQQQQQQHRHQYIEQNGLYWYPRKALAEHAAAARAWDCIQLRDGTIPPTTTTSTTSTATATLGTIPTLMGKLQPYWPSQRPSFPIDQIPPHILELLPPPPPSSSS